MKTLLVIGHTFPEPSTTAAGSRMLQLLKLFIEEEYQITFASIATISERSVDLSANGIIVENIKLNASSFNDFVTQLNPSIVIFDRYITEEQFGWRVAKYCPDAMRILDTEDLHFLRKAREVAVKKNIPVTQANLFSETAKRELASILRCDISLIISEYEMELLQNVFKIPSEILHYLPFLVKYVSEEEKKNLPDFESRSNFVAIGNLLHAPNIDAVLQLKKEIWPHIKSQLPEAKLFVYGAYAPQQILQLHNEKEGFLICGWVKNVSEVIQKTRVCLAPLRFGAGLKGKLVDVMLNGTPWITTSIGAEGMMGNVSFSSCVEDNLKAFADASVALYCNKITWLQAQENGFMIVEERFQKNHFSEAFKNRILGLSKNLEKHRITNFMGQILQHHTLKSTEYMSKWIEEKNINKVRN